MKRPADGLRHENWSEKASKIREALLSSFYFLRALIFERCRVVLLEKPRSAALRVQCAGHDGLDIIRDSICNDLSPASRRHREICLTLQQMMSFLREPRGSSLQRLATVGITNSCRSHPSELSSAAGAITAAICTASPPPPPRFFASLRLESRGGRGSAASASVRLSQWSKPRVEALHLKSRVFAGGARVHVHPFMQSLSHERQRERPMPREEGSHACV